MDLYQQSCSDLASYGYVVIALEHEDRSASYSITHEGLLNLIQLSLQVIRTGTFLLETIKNYDLQ